LQTKYHPDSKGLVKCIESRDLKGAAQRMFNVFEEVLPSGRDHVSRIKNILLENGAYGAAMTGTGSAVFGVFENEDRAKAAGDELSRHYREVFITVPHASIDF
jgi:4-diphosphocytidyl-2-C-methyl-D-erythritol kinase